MLYLCISYSIFEPNESKYKFIAFLYGFVWWNCICEVLDREGRFKCDVWVAIV